MPCPVLQLSCSAIPHSTTDQGIAPERDIRYPARGRVESNAIRRCSPRAQALSITRDETLTRCGRGCTVSRGFSLLITGSHQSARAALRRPSTRPRTRVPLGRARVKPISFVFGPSRGSIAVHPCLERIRDQNFGRSHRARRANAARSATCHAVATVRMPPIETSPLGPRDR